MNIPVSVEKVAGNGYRAAALADDRFSVEAATREEAIDRVRCLVQDRLASGELLNLEISEGPATDPWLKFAGRWKDDPRFDEFVEAMKEYRKQVDSDPDRL